MTKFFCLIIYFSICAVVVVFDRHHRGYIALVIVLVIAGIAMGTLIALFLSKKLGRRSPIIDKLTAFDNPLFFNNVQSKPDLVDTNNLVENAEEENPEPIITMWLKNSRI